jgi:hypothetical protein
LDAPGPGTFSVALSARRFPALARGRTAVRAAGRTTVRVRVTRATAKRLRRAKRLKAKLTVSFTPRGGRATKGTRSLTLR